MSSSLETANGDAQFIKHFFSYSYKLHHTFINNFMYIYVACECLSRRIEVHPRGHEEAKGESCSVYLVGEGYINNAPKTKTFAKSKLRALDQVNRNHLEATGMVTKRNLLKL